MPLPSLADRAIAPETILGSLGTVVRGIHAFADREAMLDWAVEQARGFLGCDRLLVYQFLPGGDGVVLAESASVGWQPILGQCIYDPCFQAHWIAPYQQGRTRAIDDVRGGGLDPCYAEFLTLSFGVASSVFVAEGDARSLLCCADRALYRAKKAGRNGYATDLDARKADPRE